MVAQRKPLTGVLQVDENITKKTVKGPGSFFEEVEGKKERAWKYRVNMIQTNWSRHTRQHIHGIGEHLLLPLRHMSD